MNPHDLDLVKRDLKGWVIHLIEENLPLWRDDGVDVGRARIIDFAGLAAKLGIKVTLSGATAGAHDLDGASHNALSGAVADNFLASNASGKPKDSGKSSTVLTTLGDLLYAGALAAWTRLAGNTTTTKKFLTQTGDGAASAAPAWGTIVDGDVPTTHAGSAHHAAVTLGDGSDPALALDGQELTLADVLTPAEHAALYNQAPHHYPLSLAGAAIQYVLSIEDRKSVV